ncbi:DNA/RNA nuclease SfsA [Ochrobactrum sp. POC9]|uniref:DNA/RNA nuclease SfsA n=1 Tax=unclassified Ochrobactrum TaxID=239106 RepID=UPI000D705565|nr:DNA/RNA nuclease SfsA [Ochrobactrum sp. POC9]MCH4541334.1 DNA/RNA nuclease SfsA [Ochrobactrum sp. A-1]PWU72271.1 DNA/RNA nuclease SfsA [Ochrobactrum sp. POC9]
MIFQTPLVTGRLERRYKRFLADVTLDDGRFITASVPNTGSMLGLTAPGSRVWLSVSDAPHRKYAHTLQIVEADNTLVGVNTGLPNRIAEEVILKSLIPDLAGYVSLKREQKYGRNSRIDLLLDDGPRPRAYVEVKNVHFIRTLGLAEFPDTVTARGAKHLDELVDVVAAGHRGVMLFIIQRNDCSRFSISGDLDPTYARAFERARANGVEAWAVRCQITDKSIDATEVVPIE